MKKACWLVDVPGHPPFSMVGEVMDHAEALRCAQLIWTDASVS